MNLNRTFPIIKSLEEVECGVPLFREVIFNACAGMPGAYSSDEGTMIVTKDDLMPRLKELLKECEEDWDEEWVEATKDVIETLENNSYEFILY